MKTSFHLLLSACLLSAPFLSAQTSTDVSAPATPAPTVDGVDSLKPEELDELFAPVALYPDALIAVLLPASTYSSDIVLAARYLDDGGSAEKIDEQPWDDSVRALARYPEVIQWMDENLAWTRQVGEAYLAQQSDAMASIQRLRAKAKANGALADTPQQKVVVEPAGTIAIVPAQPEVIYVPRYDPQIIYVDRPVYYDVSPIYFGLGFSVGSWLVYSCDWHHRAVYVSPRRYWHPHYRHYGSPAYWHDAPRHVWHPRYERPHFRPRPHFAGNDHRVSRPRPISDRRPDRDRWQNRPDRRPGGGSNLQPGRDRDVGSNRKTVPVNGTNRLVNRPAPGGNRSDADKAVRPPQNQRPTPGNRLAPVSRPVPDVKPPQTARPQIPNRNPPDLGQSTDANRRLRPAMPSPNPTRQVSAPRTAVHTREPARVAELQRSAPARVPATQTPRVERSAPRVSHSAAPARADAGGGRGEGRGRSR